MLPRTELREIYAETTYEVPTTPYWRGLMRRVRHERKVTQVQLAERLGVSQTTISDLESGSVKQGRAVPAICAALEIPLPWILIEDEWDEAWVDVGRLLRRLDMEMFQSYLRAFELQAGRSDSDA